MTKASFTISRRKANAEIEAGTAKSVWFLENPSDRHQLTGRPFETKEAALADSRLPNFPGYVPTEYLAKIQQGELRWATGQGRAGGDVKVRMQKTMAYLEIK